MKLQKSKIHAIGLALLLAGGCNEDFLEKAPKGTLSSETFWTTEDDAITGLTAAYSILNDAPDGRRGYMANNMVFGDIMSDDTDKGGGGANDGQDAGALELFNIFTDNRTIERKWDATYEGITRANLVIENVPQIDMDEDARDIIVGEAKFLRAYHYFQLVRIWGGVPLITTVLTPDELNQPRATEEAVWEQIETDAGEAADLLEPDNDIGRATKGAALALKAKAHLYQEEWDQSLTEIEALESLGKYSLVENYQMNFLLEGENNNESIFEVQAASGTGFNDGANYYGLTAPRDGTWWPYGCCGFNHPTDDLINEFEEGDPRMDAAAGIPGRIYFEAVYADSTEVDGEVVSRGDIPNYAKKSLMRPSQMTQFGVRGWQGPSPLNYTAIRYADVLLWKAEALNELGRTSEAEEPLNMVRARARGSYEFNPNSYSYTYNPLNGVITDPGTLVPPPADFIPDVTGVSQEAMREAIIHERRVELAAEGHRFFDLVRWGLADDLLEGFVVGKHEVMPIPQDEMDVNPALEGQQTPGY